MNEVLEVEIGFDEKENDMSENGLVVDGNGVPAVAKEVEIIAKEIMSHNLDALTDNFKINIVVKDGIVADIKISIQHKTIKEDK